jgi:hypothetical protein
MLESAAVAGFTNKPNEPAVLSYTFSLGSFLASLAASGGIGKKFISRDPDLTSSSARFSSARRINLA